MPTNKWCTIDEFRRFNGLPIDSQDPNFEPDNTLEYYVIAGQYNVLPDVSIQVRDEHLSGVIDNANKVFFTGNKMIFDSNFDKSINVYDVSVYGWGDIDDYNTKTSISVASVTSLLGRIQLTSIPSSTYSVLTADYYFSLYEIDFTQLALAAALRAGIDYFTARYMEIPNNVRIGAQAYRMDDPVSKAERAYNRTLRSIRDSLIREGKGKNITGDARNDVG